MENVIILCISIFVIAVMLSMLFVSTVPRKKTLLGVGMTRKEMQSNFAQKSVRSCRIAICAVSLAFAVIIIPIIYATSEATKFILFLLWTFAYLFAEFGTMQYFTRKLSKEFVKNRGEEKKNTVISVDTEVVRLKNDMRVSPLSMLPGAILILIQLCSCVFYKGDIFLWCMTGISALFYGIFWGMRVTAAHERSDAYSKSADINRACHYAAQRTWSVCFAVLSAISGLCFLSLYFIYAMWNKPTLTFVVIPILILSMVLGFTISDIRVRRAQNNLLDNDEDDEPVDESAFWKWGFYNNPNDPRLMVSKQYGGGWTVNIATTAGKWIIGATFAVLVGVLLFSVFMTVGVYTVPMELNVENDTVKITAAVYDTEFKTDDIEAVELISEIPDGVRTNGASMGALQLGHFQLDGYGNSMLYLSQETPPYLLIKLKDKVVIFDGGTPEKTQELYNELSELTS